MCALAGRDMNAAREKKADKERLQMEKAKATQALMTKLQSASAGAQGAVLDALNDMMGRLMAME